MNFPISYIITFVAGVIVGIILATMFVSAKNWVTSLW